MLVLCTVQQGLGVMYVNGVQVASDTNVNLAKSWANQTGQLVYNATGNGSMMCNANFSSWWAWNNRVLTAREAAQMYANPWAMFHSGSQKGFIKGTKLALTETAVVSDLRFYSHAASGDVRLALYDNASPKNLLWQSGSVTNTAANAWITVPITNGTPSSLTLAPGTYWLAWQVDSTADVPSYTAGTNSDGFYLGQVYGTFPATVNGETSTAEKWSVFLTFNPPSPGTLQFALGSYSVNENGTNAVITVSRIGGHDGAASADYATSDGTATAGSDYTATSGTLTWADGDASTKSFTVPIADDGLYEGDETFSVILSNPGGGAIIGSPANATVTITENDSPLMLLSAVSRKVHGSAGTFDLNLNLNPAVNPTVEPRQRGPTQVLFTFNKDMKATDGVLDVSEFTLTNATYVSATIVSSNLTLNLTNVVDQSKVTVVLNGISDIAGNPLAGTNAVVIRTLYGDCNQSGTVSAPDLQYVKNRLLQTANAGNFLADLNCSGTINAPDLQQVKNNLLHSAPLGGSSTFSGFGSNIPTLQLSNTPLPATLGDALGAPSLIWSSNGDDVWTPTITPDGSSAAWSGSIGDLQVSWIETTVSGPGTISFEWRVSSELNADFLAFSIAGVDQPGRISGEVDWQPLTFSIPAGTHLLRWTYAKDSDQSAGSDAGWLRGVRFNLKD